MPPDLPQREWRVEDAGPLRYLMHGEMIHGAQYRDARRRRPVPYYPSPGPVDDLFEVVNRLGERPTAVGVVGLGAGALALRTNPAQPIVFFERDERVVEIARKKFRYLDDAEGTVEVVCRDGRRALEESTRSFGLLVLDAFVADAVPAHLVTREALRVYAERTVDGGAIAFHASNKIVDLPAVLANVSRAEHMQVWARMFDPAVEEDFGDLFVERTRWVAVAPDGGTAAELFESSSEWRALAAEGESPIWSDEDAERVGVLR